LEGNRDFQPRDFQPRDFQPALPGELIPATKTRESLSSRFPEEKAEPLLAGSGRIWPDFL
jgi:hypothetical protein